MGMIDRAVQNGILKKKPDLERILSPFLAEFDVNWGAERVAYNTVLFTFFIKPSSTFSETFGLEYELLLIYVPFDTMQARTMQAINSFFSTEPVKGRAEQLVCVVVSDAHDAKQWVNTYTSEHQDLRTYVVFSKDELLMRQRHSLLNDFRMQLSERDLFDVQLPLLDDLYFFGRQDILRSIQDNIRRCENCGIFALRKTGKTSLLYKISRTIDEANIGKAFIYDAKNAKIRMRNWIELISLISEDICKAFGMKYISVSADDKFKVIDQFEKIVKTLSESSRIVIMVDEIEYISFNPPLDSHWEHDYFDMWHFLWSIQSTYRNICFIIAGVNPYVTEISSIHSIQNPLFGIVKTNYVRGLNREDIHEMCRRIGRRMGLKFDHTGIDYLYSRYGGHPLITRMALSYENQNAKKKPITFTKNELIGDEQLREETLIPFCQHVVDVLKDFYPDEYTLLEFLSIGATQDFIELSSSPLSINHLKNYGLLNYSRGVPQIGIPVVASYVRNATATEQGTLLARSIVHPDKRKDWVSNNVKTIISYMRQLEVAIRSNGTPLLFGSNSFPEADKLIDLPVAASEQNFKVFISVFSTCFVESIVNYGKSIAQSNYFWNDIKEAYPILFEALLRVKAYRNWAEHLTLNQQMQEIFDKFICDDLEGKAICEVNDVHFVLQQCVIENLRLSISLEISNLS